jgi:hypothetical protein
MLLWALELLPRQGASWRRLLLVKIALQECSQDRVSEYSTKELTNIIVTCGNLSGCYFDNSIDRRVMRYLELLFLELAGRIEKPHIRSAFGGSDFANLAHSSAFLFGACHAQGNEEGCNACIVFLTSVASEVKRKLANRHSSSSRAFSATDLKKYLFAYVKISVLSPDLGVPDMLDQVASYVTGQMKESSPAYTIQDLAAILEFFAFYERSSVAILDLFTHSGTQLRCESLTVMDERKPHKEDSAVDSATWLAALVSIMMSHIGLRIRPAEMTLISILPSVRFYSPFAEDEDKVQLMRVFELFDFDCGDMLKREILNA